MADRLPKAVGRAAEAAPPNRFLPIHVEADLAQLADGDDLLSPDRRVPTQFLEDDTQSIITSNDSPDVFFKYSANPYRGCEHGCAYWYAQPKSADVENRAILLISACNRRRSSVKYRPFAGFQNNGRTVQNG